MIAIRPLGLTVFLAYALFSLVGADEPKAPDGIREKKGKLTAELARKLLPEAASISAVDFQKLAEDPGLVKSKSLSFLLLSIDPEIADKNPEAAKEFRYLGQGSVKVVKLAE